MGQRIALAACSPAVMRMVPAGFSRKLAYGLELGVDLLKAGSDGAQQALARLGRRDAACRARQQPNPKPCFEFANGMAQRRLRNAELCRRLGKASLPRDGEKGEEIIEVLRSIHELTIICPCEF